MSAKKILITGAGGYIGSVATYLFLQKGYQIVAIDNFSVGFKQSLEVLQEKFGKDNLIIYERDLHDPLNDIFETEKDIQAVLHYAGFTSVNDSMSKPHVYFSNNLCTPQNLMSTMIQFGIKKMVFSSTCAMYGEAQYIPIDEKHPINPTNTYGKSKRMAEEIMEWYDKLLDFRFMALRYFNVCGATEDGLMGDSKKPSVHLMQNAVKGALGLHPFYLTYSEVDTLDKSPIRDYVNVVDLGMAHLRAVEYLLAGGESQIINLGTGEGNSVLEIVKMVERITGVKLQREVKHVRSGEYGTMIASTKKAKDILNWEATTSVEDSVNSLIRWYKDHPEGWQY